MAFSFSRGSKCWWPALRKLERETARLKRLLDERDLDIEAMKKLLAQDGLKFSRNEIIPGFFTMCRVNQTGAV